MKIIEAMKRVKANKVAMQDLRTKIQANSAHLNYETPTYENPKAKIAEWAQGHHDLARENVRLLVAIQRTNLATMVDIRIGDKLVTHCIAEWVWRRREYSQLDVAVWQSMGDRGLKEGSAPSSTGNPVTVSLVRNFDPELRDKKLSEFSGERSLIDAALEVTNAITDLLE